MNERKKYYKELKGTQKVLRKKERFVELFKIFMRIQRIKRHQKMTAATTMITKRWMVTPTPNIQLTKQTDKQPSKKKHNDNIKI